MERFKQALDEIIGELERDIPDNRKISSIEDIINELLACWSCGHRISLDDCHCDCCDVEISWD